MFAVEITLTCVAVIFLSWVWSTLNWVWLKPRKLEKQLRQQGLKGNRYRILVGDMEDTKRMRSEEREKPIPFTNDYFRYVLPFVRQLLDKYGENCFTWLGPMPAINITDPELMREALTKTNDFQKMKLNPVIKVIAPGLVSYEGEKWAMHRRLLNPAFHMGKLKLMLSAVSTGIMETIDKWEKTVSVTGAAEIDVWPDLIAVAADAISRAAFGSSYEEGRKIFELLREQAELTIRLFQSIYLPGWSYLPTKNNRRMKGLNAEIRRLVEGIIERRSRALEAGEPAKDDLLGILMESNFKEKQQSHDSGMSFQDVVDECKLFYLAGHESTALLLTWTMILLSKHQDWQARARQEALEKFGKDQPDFEGLSHLKTMTMILYEVLRLYPLVPTLSRSVYSEGIKLGDISVPKGVTLRLSVLHAHHDPKLWGDDALEFNPERFSQGVAKATKGNVSFFPFGWGPRICIGQNFALAEAKMAFAMILQRFSFELSPSYAHAPNIVLNLQPRLGAHLILRQL